MINTQALDLFHSLSLFCSRHQQRFPWAISYPRYRDSVNLKIHILDLYPRTRIFQNTNTIKFYKSKSHKAKMSTSSHHPVPPLVRFYSPTTSAPINNRTLTQILAYSDSALEYHHDYIQILFPLPEGSPFNPSAPIIDKATFREFRQSKELHDQLLKSLKRMLSFYGFEICTALGVKVIPAPNFQSASKNWVKKFNHNHLRITRILRSLRVLGLELEAVSFLQALELVYDEGGGIGRKSVMFWKRAVERPLWMKPEDENGEGEEGGWLWEWEIKKGDESNELG